MRINTLLLLFFCISIQGWSQDMVQGDTTIIFRDSLLNDTIIAFELEEYAFIFGQYDENRVLIGNYTGRINIPILRRYGIPLKPYTIEYLSSIVDTVLFSDSILVVSFDIMTSELSNEFYFSIVIKDGNKWYLLFGKCQNIDTCASINNGKCFKYEDSTVAQFNLCIPLSTSDTTVSFKVKMFHRFPTGNFPDSIYAGLDSFVAVYSVRKGLDRFTKPSFHRMSVQNIKEQGFDEGEAIPIRFYAKVLNFMDTIREVPFFIGNCTYYSYGKTPKASFSVSDEIIASPNPTMGVISLAINEYWIRSGKWQIEVYNQLGQFILQTQNTLEIDLSPYPSGVYFIRFTSWDRYNFNCITVIKQ